MTVRKTPRPRPQRTEPPIRRNRLEDQELKHPVSSEDGIRLAAMMVVRNEWDRYLYPCLQNLIGFCDEVRILDDASEDGWQEKAAQLIGPEYANRVRVLTQETTTFFNHEGRTRQSLLEWTMEAAPTHILAIDADEFVGDGSKLRRTLRRYPETDVFTLNMQEIWKVDKNELHVRQDGGWREHPVAILFRVPTRTEFARNRQLVRQWSLPDRALACGRVPSYVNTRLRGRTLNATDILHFGWACEADRVARHHRYAVADGGKFHQSTHLDSILWGDEKISMSRRRWPRLIDKDEIYARASRSKFKMTTS